MLPAWKAVLPRLLPSRQWPAPAPVSTPAAAPVILKNDADAPAVAGPAATRARLIDFTRKTWAPCDADNGAAARVVLSLPKVMREYFTSTLAQEAEGSRIVLQEVLTAPSTPDGKCSARAIHGTLSTRLRASSVRRRN